MLKSIPSFLSVRIPLPKGSRGAAALLTVIGIMAAMLLIASTVGFRARQELRMSRADTDAVRMQELVSGKFNELAAQAAEVGYAPNDDGTVGCTPPSFPGICATVLTRRTNGEPYEYFPVRVTYQRAPGSEKREFYGWILRWLNADGTAVIDVRTYHYYFWCPPPEDYGYGPCKIG